MTIEPPSGAPDTQWGQAEKKSFVLNKPGGILLGALYGLLLRLVFKGDKEGILQGFSAMTAAFALVAPFAIGAITVYVAERQDRQTIGYYIVGPWMAMTLFLTGTVITLIEGSICIIMASPLFFIGASIGGLCMGAICRMLPKPLHTMQAIAVLPLLLMLGERQIALPNDVQQVRQSIYIDAPAPVVWQLINYPLNIQPEEMKGGWAYLIGVPYPLEARTLDGKVGGKRRLQWQRGVSFDEQITEWQPNQKVAWTYQFQPDSFPPGSMDDHVMVGGDYFNLVDTSYTLTPHGKGTRLDVLVDYRVSTHFNWYAKPLAHAMIDNTAATILNFYKLRSEKTGKAPI